MWQFGHITGLAASTGFSYEKVFMGVSPSQNIGTQGMQELFFYEFKACWRSYTHWTLNSDKVNLTSFFSYKCKAAKKNSN